MGYGTDGLTFNSLRGANQARLPEFRNKHGELAHSQRDGSDWSPAQWLQAVVGELGEFANLRKKFERGDLSAEEYATEAAKELADVQTYLDILAMRCLDANGVAHPTGVNLGKATMDKFNEVSERVNSSVRLRADDWYYVGPHAPIRKGPGMPVDSEPDNLRSLVQTSLTKWVDNYAQGSLSKKIADDLRAAGV